MPRLDLIYFRGCPSVGEARKQLARAVAQSGATITWSEWLLGDPAAPDRVRGYGSPTVLIDGRDVAGVDQPVGGPSCRLYAGEDGETRGAPPVAMIVAALREALAREAEVGEAEAEAGAGEE